ncbi:MAG: DUF2061 domain-containing protein [Pseudomonadota bacterium]
MTATALLLKPILNPSRQQGASAKRSVVKALTYGLVLGCLDFVVLYLFTRKTAVALGFIVVSNIYTTICYFIYERIWVRITWGKIELEPVVMSARRRGVRSTVARTRKFLRHAMLHKPKDDQP